MMAAAFKVTPDLVGADIASGVMAGALAHPEKPALLFEDRCLTFAQLAERIQRVAALARHEMRLHPGDCAAIYAPNCLAYIELVAGLSRAGIMVATPTHRAVAEELRGILENCRAQAVFCAAELAGSLGKQIIRDVMVLDAGYEAALTRQSLARPIPPADPEDTFCIPYTSGTTGEPKGVMLSHRSRSHLFKTMAHHFRCLGAEDRHLCFAPLAHGGGFGFAMASIFNGGTLELLSAFDPAHVLERLTSGEVDPRGP